MPRKPEFFEPEVSPGELYKKIVVSRDEFGKGEKSLVKRKEPAFVNFCKAIYKSFPSLGTGAKLSQEYREAIDFLGWDLKAEEFAATTKFAIIAGMIFAITIGFILVLSPVFSLLSLVVEVQELVYVYLFAPFFALAFVITILVQRFPLSAAKEEQTKALGYVPELLGYMIMSMKLVPNLEKAVEFSAEHGRGKIAEDFRRMLWETQIGLFNSLSEALDALAYRWGKFSDEFKRALMMIRASVLENTEAKRYQLLDKTMETVLESIKNKMEQYARNLSQPSTVLFYVGVLLPLILIIILPVGSAFSGTPMAMPVVLIMIYNIMIPIGTLVFAHHVIKQRPPTYVPPKIPDDYPGLPKKNTMIIGKSSVNIFAVAAIILIAGIGLSVFVSQQGLPPKAIVEDSSMQLIQPDPVELEIIKKEKGSEDFFELGGRKYIELRSEGNTDKQATDLLAIERQRFFMDAKHDITPYILVFGVIISIVLAFFVFVYYSNVYKRRVQREIMQMESEFKDSLYVLASRLGENKPVEEALKHTKNFLPGMLVSQRIFGKTVENIELLGMPLNQAIFDKNYGSLKNIPSTTIQSAMKILVDSVELGVNVAARTLISLSLQLSNAEKVNRMLATLIADVVSMMRTMVVFIAPIVLGVTTSLQKIVMITLAGIATSETVQNLSQAGGSSGDVGLNIPLQGISIESFQTMVSPVQFLIIVTIYVIELVVIMGYFTTKIEEDNNLLAKMNIALMLPIAVIVFLVAVIAANFIVGNFFAGEA